LKKFDQALYDKPRWLVLNKLDMVPADSARRGSRTSSRLRYKGPVFQISALTREGCELLVQKVYEHIAAVQAQRAAQHRHRSPLRSRGPAKNMTELPWPCNRSRTTPPPRPNCCCVMRAASW
jgi:GTPase involved in cell partitioning and DNA repair